MLISWHPPEDEAVRAWQEIQLSGEVALAHGDRQLAEWAEGQQITHILKRGATITNERFRPGWQIFRRRLFCGQDAKAGLFQVRWIANTFTISLLQEPNDEQSRISNGPLLTGWRIKSFPECARWPLLTVAE